MFPAVVLSLLLSWVQVSSETYVVKSSAGEERAKLVLRELEGFHQLMGSLVFRSTQLPELPIEVLLIGDEPTLKELAPVYQGRKIDVAGYYQRGLDRDFIVLSGRERPKNLTSIAYHELTHYFLSRALVNRPAWLSEGLAEYFSTADIRSDRIVLGGLSTERLQILRTERLLPMETFFAVDSSSPYYNEQRKANVFYAQSWAFIYYMMHGDHAEAFKQFIDASTRSEANLFDYIKVKPAELEGEFQNYLRVIVQRARTTTVKINAQTLSMKVDAIPDAQAQISMGEIFLSSGNTEQAQHYFEAVNTMEEEFPRASYYRGVLARLAGNPEARDFFIDALSDPQLGPRAAVQLVQMGELHIPTVRTLLQQAAAENTRHGDVYLALSDIYTDELRRIEEAVRLRQRAERANLPTHAAAETPEPEVIAWQSYANGAESHTAWELMSSGAEGPHLETFAAPFYPPDLLDQKTAGQVVIEAQITERGDVAGVWLVSSDPEIFGTLATAAVRDWRFEPGPAKIRVVLDFKP